MSVHANIYSTALPAVIVVGLIPSANNDADYILWPFLFPVLVDNNNNASLDCPKEAFQCESDGTCLPRKMVCDGHIQCRGGSDESRCYKGEPFTDWTLTSTKNISLFNCTGIACDKQAWQCKSGQCVPQVSQLLQSIFRFSKTLLPFFNAVFILQWTS